MFLINEPRKGFYCVIDTKAARMVPNTLTRDLALAQAWKAQAEKDAKYWDDINSADRAALFVKVKG